MSVYFYYFLNMFSDYNTGKEIRVYNEQTLIKHTATDKLLTDGERVLKKASMNTARQSSFVAILGALVGFGIYLFIGTKGLYGLFGIGSLVLYCGAFMQIIAGIMKMAVTFCKTAEMVPLVNYYFEIVNTNDEMTYGEKKLDLSAGFELEFKNVSFKYPSAENYALRNVNLKIENGEHLAVVGRNGSGKSSIVKLLLGEDIPHTGTLRTASGLIVSYMPQDTSFLRGNVLDFARENGLDETLFLTILRKLDFPRVQFEKDMRDFSGGQKKKALLAKTLSERAHLYVWDEPLNFVDVLSRMQIRDLLLAANPTILFVEHDRAFVDEIATRSILL